MHTHSPHLSRLRRLVFLVAMIFIQNFSQSGSAPNRKATKHVEIPSIKHHQSYSVCAISSAHANEAPHSPNLLLLQISHRHLHTRPSSGGNGLKEGPSIHTSIHLCVDTGVLSETTRKPSTRLLLVGMSWAELNWEMGCEWIGLEYGMGSNEIFCLELLTKHHISLLQFVYMRSLDADPSIITTILWIYLNITWFSNETCISLKHSASPSDYLPVCPSVKVSRQIFNIIFHNHCCYGKYYP